MATVTDEFPAVALGRGGAAVADVPVRRRNEDSALAKAWDFVRHPNNHKQAFRFLCVGGSGYIVTTLSFAVFIHVILLQHTAAFALASLMGMINNFWWNRNWTFDATHHHIGKQGFRSIAVAIAVAIIAYVIYTGLAAWTGMDKVLAEALAYIIVTPASFLTQKLWSFKA